MDRSLTFQSALRRRCACCPLPLEGTSARRRTLLFGAAAALAGCASRPPAPAPGEIAIDTSRSAGRIDVHHHVSPPQWVAALRAQGALDPLIASWTPERTLADMDRAGIAQAVLSITTPGLYLPGLGTEGVRRVARESNDYMARLAADSRGRFGFFAALPMLDAEGSLREIAYALDVLKADGIGLITSYGDKWLGDPLFFPVMEELNRRRAVVYTHPTAANCCSNLQPEVPPVMIEFGTDTTRAIASILFNGNVQRFGEVRWIFSHAGGTMPFLIERFVRHPILAPKVAPMFPDGVAPILKRFWYDTAQTANAPAMSALTKVVPVQQIVFGTDFPYRTGLDHVKGLRACGVFSEADLRLIERETSRSLLPRLRA